MINNEFLLYLVYFIMIGNIFGYISTKKHDSLTLLLVSFFLIYKIYDDNLVISMVSAIFITSFYTTFLVKKEGFEAHHHNNTKGETLDEHLNTTNNTDNDDDDDTSDDEDAIDGEDVSDDITNPVDDLIAGADNVDDVASNLGTLSVQDLVDRFSTYASAYAAVQADDTVDDDTVDDDTVDDDTVDDDTVDDWSARDNAKCKTIGGRPEMQSLCDDSIKNHGGLLYDESAGCHRAHDLWTDVDGNKFNVCCDLTSDCGVDAEDQDTWWETYDFYDCDGNDEDDFDTTNIPPSPYPRTCLYAAWHSLIALEQKFYGSNKRDDDKDAVISIRDHAIHIFHLGGGGDRPPTSYIILYLEYLRDLIIILIDQLIADGYLDDNDDSFESQLFKIYNDQGPHPDTADSSWNVFSIGEKYDWVKEWHDTITPQSEVVVDGFKSNNKLRNKILKNKKMDSKFVKKKGNQLTKAVLFGWNAFKKEIIK